MPPRPRPDRRTSRTRLARGLAGFTAIVGAAVVLGACSASFDPSGPCTSDGTAAGAYPQLEAFIPKTFHGGPPGQVNSGRTCTVDGLGTLKAHGIDEMHFAGGTWSTGDDSGVSLATFESAGPTPLQPGWLTEFYATGAANGSNVDTVTTNPYEVAPGVIGQKVDVTNGEQYQSVVVWGHEGRVEVALIGDFIRAIQTKDAHEAIVRDAVNAWALADGAPTVPPATPATSAAPSGEPSPAAS